MSQTWIIKDNAPVDGASRELSSEQCSFTSNGSKFSSISIVENPGEEVYVLTYDTFEVAGSGHTAFVWVNEAYKTLEFDTAPTGELLAWLQKNADEQSDQEYLTRKSELTSVAAAIRAKSGTTAQLIYPDGFISAINAITTVSPKLATITFSIASNSSINPHFVFATYISQDKKLIQEGKQGSIQDRTSPFNIQTIQDSLLFMYHSGSASLAVSNSSGMQYGSSGGGIYLIPQAEICTCELFYPGD